MIRPRTARPFEGIGDPAQCAARGSPRLDLYQDRNLPLYDSRDPQLDETREHPRVPVWGRSVWLSWGDHVEGVGVLADLVNISRGGVMVLSPCAPRLGQSVQFTLDEAGAGPSVRAIVRDITWGRVWRRLHLEFLAPCPDEFFEAATREPD